MPRFLVTRTVPPSLKEEELVAAGRLNKSAAEEVGIRWVKSYYSAKDGKFYCEYEAPNIEAIYEHARRTQFPLDFVSLISDEFDPTMFK
jgi:Protein of unknown function (DUF4242)